MNDPDRIVTAEMWARAVAADKRQLDPFVVSPAPGFGGLPAINVVELPVGLYKINMFGLLPVAIRITAEQSNEQWFANRRGEVIRFFQEPLIRLINPGEKLLWRPLFDFEPWSELNIIRLARPSTFGG